MYSVIKLADSAIEETRYYWRKRLGFTSKVALDPRPIKVIVQEILAQRSN